MIVVELNEDVRSYPLRILVWHELVNDEIGGQPVMATYCPLCITAPSSAPSTARSRTFGVSGKLRRNDLIMYDVETETLWQQISGEAIVGTDAGTQLAFVPSQIVSFGDFRTTFPDAMVLTRIRARRSPTASTPTRSTTRVAARSTTTTSSTTAG